jgi:dTMP kinase
MASPRADRPLRDTGGADGTGPPAPGIESGTAAAAPRTPPLADVPPPSLRAATGAHREPGILIVLEGIDGSGRSTHVRLLEQRVRYSGLGVTRTSLGTSVLAAEPIRRSRHARRADPAVTALLDAADLAERIALVVRPALRAGLVVIADRWAYTPMARAAVRGVDAAWLEAVFSFGPPPDAVLWLDLDPADALARRTSELDAYEAGMDLGLATDLRESYLLFGARLAASFHERAARYAFTRVSATGSVEAVASRIRSVADSVIDGRVVERGRIRP